MPDDDQLESLRNEVDRLRAENEQLRSRFRVDQPEPDDPVAPDRSVRVLLLPDPAQPTEPGRTGPEAITGVAEVLIRTLRERQPDFEWRAEHDLARIPKDAECFQVGQVLQRMWNGEGPLPTAFRVERDVQGEPHVRRCVIDGAPDSDRFKDYYNRQLRIVDDLLAEGQGAHDAGAHHHAAWLLKAVDLVLAQLNLALVDFRTGGARWRQELSKPRPEYDPRYAVEPSMPIGV